MIQTPDQPASLSTQGMSSLEYAEPEMSLPQPIELQALAAEEHRRAMISSYENVYTGVPLEPEKSKMSMDASEIEIGDRFDTKQSDSRLHSGISSSYENLYEKPAEELTDEEGECMSDSSSIAVASSVIDVRSSFASSITSHTVNSFSSPVYITVESGLDKLACSSETLGGAAGNLSSSRVKVDLGERSASCDTGDLLSEGPKPMTRPVSSPDVTHPVDAGIPHVVDKGRQCYMAFVSFSICLRSQLKHQCHYYTILSLYCVLFSPLVSFADCI